MKKIQGLDKKITFCVFFGLILFIIVFDGFPHKTEYPTGSLNMKIEFPDGQDIAADFSPFIQGQFIIQGTGGSEIDEIHLYFDELEVYSSDDRNFFFSFNTMDYPKGWKKIRLIGMDSEENLYEKCLFRYFSHHLYGWSFVIAISMILGSIVGFALMHKPTKHSSNKKPSEISIENI